MAFRSGLQRRTVAHQLWRWAAKIRNNTGHDQRTSSWTVSQLLTPVVLDECGLWKLMQQRLRFHISCISSVHLPFMASGAKPKHQDVVTDGYSHLSMLRKQSDKHHWIRQICVWLVSYSLLPLVDVLFGLFLGLRASVGWSLGHCWVVSLWCVFAAAAAVAAAVATGWVFAVLVCVFCSFVFLPPPLLLVCCVLCVCVFVRRAFVCVCAFVCVVGVFVCVCLCVFRWFWSSCNLFGSRTTVSLGCIIFFNVSSWGFHLVLFVSLLFMFFPHAPTNLCFFRLTLD